MARLREAFSVIPPCSSMRPLARRYLWLASESHIVCSPDGCPKPETTQNVLPLGTSLRPTRVRALVITFTLLLVQTSLCRNSFDSKSSINLLSELRFYFRQNVFELFRFEHVGNCSTVRPYWVEVPKSACGLNLVAHTPGVVKNTLVALRP